MILNLYLTTNNLKIKRGNKVWFWEAVLKRNYYNLNDFDDVIIVEHYYKVNSACLNIWK